MAEETTDDNTDTDIVETDDSDQGADSSSDTELEFTEDGDGFVTTTDPVEVSKDKGQDQEKTTSEKTEKKTKTEESEKKTPYHLDENWQRIIKERDEAKSKLESFEKASKTKPEGKQAKGSKVLAMKADDIVNKFTNDPHSFLKDFAIDIQNEIYQGIDNRTQAEKQQSQKAIAENAEKEVLTEFFDKRPDGVEMLHKGEIQKFMSENPGHNAMSAYNKLSKTESVPKTDVAKMVKDAVSKAIKESNKELKAMGRASSKSSTTTKKAVVSSSDEMKDPNKHGGPRAVAAKRFRERAAR